MEAMPAAEVRADEHTVQVDNRTRNRILFAVLVGLFLSALDQTIVGTALPQIVTDLSGNELYTWVVTIYLLTSTITGPIYGKLSDQFGRKLLLLIGIGLFLLGSFLCGLAQDMVQLILFRGLQGLGAGALFPISLAVIGDLFSPKERGKYQGLFGAVFGVAAIIGPALGGFLTDQVSWHWVFWVNLPLGAIAMYIIWRLLPAHTESGVTRTIDYLGVAIFTAAVVPILIGLTNMQNPQLGWSDPWTGGLIVLGLMLGLVFLWIETRAKEPIVPLGLFRNRTYSVSILAGALASFGFFGAIIFLPRWYQVVVGSTATESGYQLLPLLAGLILGSIVSGQIVSRTGRYKWLAVGSLFTLTGALLLMTNLDASTPPQMVWIWQFFAGLGIGPTLAVFTIIVQNAVPWQMLGVATSNLAFFRQMGGTIGLAIAGAIFGSTLQTQAPPQVASALTAAGAPQQMIDQLGTNLGSGGFSLDQLSAVGDMGARILESIRIEAGDQVAAMVQPFISAIVAGVHEAFSLAIANTMWIGAAAAFVAALATLALREMPLRTSVHEGSMVARRPTAGVPATD